MEYRKLIKFGNSSHIISLPSYWIKKNSMNKGSLVYFKENGKGELILNAQEINEEPKESEIELEPTPYVGDLRRKLITSYVEGYDKIIINTSSLKNLDKVRFYVNTLMSLEIIEQKENKVIVKDLLNLKEINIDKQVKRIDIQIRTMFEDSKLSHKERNYEEIYNIDYEVTKLTYLGQRIIKKCLTNTNLMKDVKIKPENTINLWEVFKSLITISHCIKSISKNMSRIKKEENIEEIIELYTSIQEEYLKAMKAYYKNDKKTSYEIDSRKNKIIKECDNLIERYQNPKITSILEHMKNIELSVKNICKSV